MEVPTSKPHCHRRAKGFLEEFCSIKHDWSRGRFLFKYHVLIKKYDRPGQVRSKSIWGLDSRLVQVPNPEFSSLHILCWICCHPVCWHVGCQAPHMAYSCVYNCWTVGFRGLRFGALLCPFFRKDCSCNWIGNIHMMSSMLMKAWEAKKRQPLHQFKMFP